MKKRLLLWSLLLLSAVMARGQGGDGEMVVNGVGYTVISDREVKVSGLYELPENSILEIPASVEIEGRDYVVTTYDLSYAEYSNGRMLVLPESIKEIGSMMYENLFNYLYLKSLTPPVVNSWIPKENIMIPSVAVDNYITEGWDRERLLSVEEQNDSLIWGYNENWELSIHAWLKDIAFIRDEYNRPISTKIVIPDEIKGIPVRCLSPHLFSNLKSFVSDDDSFEVNFSRWIIKLPSSLRYIGRKALPTCELVLIAPGPEFEADNNQGDIYYNPDMTVENSTIYYNPAYFSNSDWEPYSYLSERFGSIIPCNAIDDQFVYVNYYEQPITEEERYWKDPDGLEIVKIANPNMIENKPFVIPDVVEAFRKNDWEEPQQLPVVSIADSVSLVKEKYYDNVNYWRLRVDELFIPANIRHIGIRSLPIPRWEDISVSPDNEAYMFKDGKLTTIDGKTLVQITYYADKKYYGGRVNSLDGIETVLPGAFDNIDADKLRVPESVKEISGNALALADIGEFIVDEGNTTFKVINGALVRDSLLVSFPMGRDYYNKRIYTSLEVPIEISVIDNYAFGSGRDQWSTFSLDSLVLQSEIPPMAYATSFHEDMYKETTVIVPANAINTYLSTEPWSRFVKLKYSSLDDADFQILKDFYANADNGYTWYNRWEFGETASQTHSLHGVRITDGHVTSIDLSDNGLSGTLPDDLFRLPYLQSLNLFGNRLEGPIEDMVPENVGDCPITSLDLSRNNLTGNVGPLGQRLPNLTSLDVSSNKLTDVYPMLPSRITDLNLNYQTMDATLDYSQLIGQIDPEGELPSLLFYNHYNQSYRTNETFTLETGEGSYWSMHLDRDNNTNQLRPTSCRNVFKHPNGTMLQLSTEDSGHNATVCMKFDTGDVNFDTYVSLPDMQLTINHALDRTLLGIFNQTAADIIADEWVNVQDVVCLVNILMNQEGSRKMRRAPVLKGADENAPETEARLYWRGDELVLQTQREVAAIDLWLSGSAQVEWLMSDDEGFSHAQRASSGGMHIILYSLEGKTIPAGETILARATGGQARVSDVEMVDLSANNISVVASYEATGIMAATDGLGITADRRYLNISTSQHLTNVQWSIYSLNGTLLRQGSTDGLTVGRSRMPLGLQNSGQVVVRLKSDQTTVTKRININQ